MSLGVGVMLGVLGGNQSTVEAVQASIGLQIKRLYIDPDYNKGDGGLCFEFEGGETLWVYDAGRSCCESRYMHTDDNLDYFSGSIFQGIEIREGGSVSEGDYDDVKESQFLVITTSKGVITVANYNEHNGYYGGFWMEAIRGE